MSTSSDAVISPRQARRRFTAMLEEAGLPRFDSHSYDSENHELQLYWRHGFALCLDLTCADIEPLDVHEEAAILDMPGWEPIHVSVPASPDDPRDEVPRPPGVIVHRVPELHPDDMTVVDGIRTTSVSRTLIDCAECMDELELRDCFQRARELGLLDMEALHASRARVEWRPSLAMVDRIIADFEE